MDNPVEVNPSLIITAVVIAIILVIYGIFKRNKTTIEVLILWQGWFF